MDRKTLLSISLCFLIFLGWQKFYIEPRTTKAGAVQETSQVDSQKQPPQTAATSTTSATAITPPKAEAQKQIAFEEKPLPVSIGSAKVGNGNRIFTGWDLKSYRLNIAPEAAAVDLSSVTHSPSEGEIAFDLSDYAYLSDVKGTLQNIPGGYLWVYEDERVKLTRETTSHEGQPYVSVKIDAQFKGDKRPNHLFVSTSQRVVKDDREAQDRALVYWTDKSVQRRLVGDISELVGVSTPVKWIGATNRYFLLTFVSDGPVEPRGLIQPLGGGQARASLVYPLSGNSISVPLKVYFGPKELNLLRSVEPSLDHTVDFGWFTFFAYPMLKLMKWFYEIFHNYGVAIIMLTLLVRVVTYPLNYKSMKSMKDMARLQPQLQRLRERYKDDKEALNREMMTLMRTHGYNPAAGCVPILIQMPIFFALYRVLYSAVELYQAPFFLWIHDLSAKDPFYITPVLLTATMFLQQKLTPNTATDPAQQKMLQFMPVIFGVFMLTLPSGLTLYMLVNALGGIVQQLILNKKLGGNGNVAAVAAKAR